MSYFIFLPTIDVFTLEFMVEGNITFPFYNLNTLLSLAIPSCYPTTPTWFVHCDEYRGIQFVLVEYVPSMLHWHNGFEGWYLTTKSCEDMIRYQWLHTLQGSCL